MSNNLIPTSKFYKLPELVNTRDVGKHRTAKKPPRKDDLWSGISPKGFEPLG